MLKVIFMGTPDFAVPVLDAVNSAAEIVAVVTQVDKPSGRNLRPTFSPVKVEAMRLGLPVLQYERISRDGYEELNNLGADIIVTCAYGQILRENILNMTRYGVYNVHASVLPHLRGAAPIARAIINGDKETGITILKSAIGIDDGDILFSRKIDILDTDTCGTLSRRLSTLGAECIVDALRILESNNFTLLKQDDSKSTYASMLKDSDEVIDFSKDASSVVNLVRGLNPTPTAKFTYNGLNYKCYEARVVDSSILSKLNVSIDNFVCGQVMVSSPKHGFIVKCNNSACEIVTLMPAGGKMMSAKAYLNGKKIEVGSTLNE